MAENGWTFADGDGARTEETVESPNLLCAGDGEAGELAEAVETAQEVADYEPEEDEKVSAASIKKVLKELKDEAKKCEEVFLAPDPDREGEAISWHIYEILREKGLAEDRPLDF